VVGPLDERLPRRLDPTLDRWVEDDDFWMRRAALLTHLIPLRHQRGDWPRFCRYADELLADREFFVAKAIGWVLRDTARRRPNLVLDWVEPRGTRMQSVTFREVLKPFSAEVQQRLRDYRSHH
jgi:3-methyladenine DNA glycosylase AlkD